MNDMCTGKKTFELLCDIERVKDIVEVERGQRNHTIDSERLDKMVIDLVREVADMAGYKIDEIVVKYGKLEGERFITEDMYGVRR